MYNFFVNDDCRQGDRYVITGADHNHIKNVLRMKIGDTISDIKEGLAAGVITVGVVEGSSIMGLTEEQYEALPNNEKEALCKDVEKQFKDAGADYVIRNFSEFPALLEQLS